MGALKAFLLGALAGTVFFVLLYQLLVWIFIRGRAGTQKKRVTDMRRSPVPVASAGRIMASRTASCSDVEPGHPAAIDAHVRHQARIRQNVADDRQKGPVRHG
jgi:hypothetical protein